MFYGEVNDVLAAADYLARLPYVDAKRIYVSGHSVGGKMTLLAALTSNRFRAAASFSGSCDQVAWSRGQMQLVPCVQAETVPGDHFSAVPEETRRAIAFFQSKR